MNWSRKMPKSVCVLLLGTALLSCSDQKEIQITGTVRNLNGGMIVYQQSIAGMMNTKTIDTLQIQSDSTFTLTLPVEDYERVNFILYGKAVLGSVISKGGKIQLDVDATAQEPLTIQGEGGSRFPIAQSTECRCMGFACPPWRPLADC